MRSSSTTTADLLSSFPCPARCSTWGRILVSTSANPTIGAYPRPFADLLTALGLCGSDPKSVEPRSAGQQNCARRGA